MTKTTRAARSARKAMSTAQGAAAHAADGAEMLRAASDVIAARLDIIGQGLADPSRTDLVELHLMGAEKVEALAASGAALATSFGDVAARALRSGLDEAGHAARAASAMALARTPQGAVSAQMTYLTGWWGRTASQALTLQNELVRAQAEALKPIHAAATANARRLKR